MPSLATAQDQLPFTFTNDTGRGEPVQIYVIGVDIASGQLGYSDAEGNFSPWPAGGSPPVPAPDVSFPGPADGSSSTFQVPKDFSGRIYFSLGGPVEFGLTEDGVVQPAPWIPSDANADTLLDWSEFTYNDIGLFLNSSQVDMLAIPHTVGSTGSSGETQTTGTVEANGRQQIIDGMLSDPDWAGTVQVRDDGTVLRVLSPGKAADAGAFDPNYLDSYIDEAWNAYTSKTLTVVPFDDQQDVRFSGTTSGNTMTFTDADGAQVATFEKPTTSDVWGCDGALGAPNDLVVGPIARTLCAALVRGTLGTIDTQPSLDDDEFYQNSTPNLYGDLIHDNMLDGKAYAFAFDDVGNFESLVNEGAPVSASITLDPFVGGGQVPAGGDATPDVPDSGTPEEPTYSGPEVPDSGTQDVPVDGVSVVSELNGFCIDVPRSNFTDGTGLGMWQCNGTDAQSWSIADGRVEVANGQCMTAAGGFVEDGTAIQIASCSDDPAQQFTLNEAGDLVNEASDKCVDILDASFARDAPLILYSCSGMPNQKWTVRD